MRRTVLGIVLVAVVATAGAGDEARLGTHAIRGRVRSVNATALVIRRSSNQVRDLRFVLTAATEREGALVVGDPVSIRYITHGDELIATAVASESRGGMPRER